MKLAKSGEEPLGSPDQEQVPDLAYFPSIQQFQIPANQKVLSSANRDKTKMRLSVEGQRGPALGTSAQTLPIFSLS